MAIVEPARPLSRYLEVPAGGSAASVRLHALDWGGPSGSRPVVLLHGLSSSARIWDFVAPRLAERFRVVALDQRSHGLSDRPESDYSFAEVCGDLLAVLDALAFEAPALIGHSWGAAVALQFAADHPQRVSALALVDGGFGQLSARLSWEEAERLLRPPDIDGLPLATFLASAKGFPDIREVWSPAVEEILLSCFLVEGGRIYRRLKMHNHMKIVRALYEQDTPALYKRVRCPVLLVPALPAPSGEQERRQREWREDGVAAALARLKDARVAPFDDTGHDVPLLRPDGLSRVLIEFLSAG
jgi:pimeloyl-ACP methyl ester carboxylesterase